MVTSDTPPAQDSATAGYSSAAKGGVAGVHHHPELCLVV